MRLRNSTDIPNEIVKDVIRFVRPPGISKFRVEVVDSIYAYAGRGGYGGVRIRINTKTKYPRRHYTYQRGQLRGRRYYIGSLVEMLVYMFAHELMHTRQSRKRVRGRVWGARGKYSEIETESYAIRKLREWRKSH